MSPQETWGDCRLRGARERALRGGRFQGGALLRGRMVGLGLGGSCKQPLQTCQRPLAACTHVHVKDPTLGDGQGRDLTVVIEVIQVCNVLQAGLPAVASQPSLSDGEMTGGLPALVGRPVRQQHHSLPGPSLLRAWWVVPQVYATGLHAIQGYAQC